jgi:TatD DNase family protein
MKFIDIHTHNRKYSNEETKVINLFPWETFPKKLIRNNRCSAGIHPWFIDGVDVEESLWRIESWMKNGSIQCIGETGLDGIRGPDLQVQLELFKKHVALSESFRCPLIIHCVRSYNEIVSLKYQMAAKQPWILHGFYSSVQMMKQLLNAGVYLSIGSSVVRASKKIVALCKLIPNERLFLETDDSGVELKTIYELVAGLRGQKIDELKEVVFINYKRIFES